jgi:hypothetical protein
MTGDMQNKRWLVTGDRFWAGHPPIPFVGAPVRRATLRKIVKFQDEYLRRRQKQDPVEKEAKTDAELEDMILQRLVIGGVFVSVRKDPLLGWRPTVVTAPKHTRNAQELADKIAAELRKKFVLKD